ncbi:MAG: tyrosine-type recombinase/integrase [Patescibacteria group bacterium]|nr:tyrosine-type recombinase/integrase [Patescibacteria group bacterium]
MAAYNAAIGGYTSRPGATVAAAVSAYYQHNSFSYALAPGTQASRRAILERFREGHGDKRIGALKRVHVATILGAMKPHAARNWLKALRGLMAFCLDTGWIEEDPTEGIKRAKAPQTGGHHSWTEADIAQFEGRWPIGSRPRLAMALLLYTALRRGDMVHLGPQHFDGTRITLRKTSRGTGKTLRLAVHPALAAIVAATPCSDLTYLVTAYGRPFTAAGFGNWFREQCDLAGLPHCSAHGLRKAALRRVAEAGGSVHHLKGLGGHDTLGELDLYTKDVDQARLAEAAISIMAEAFPVTFPATDQEQESVSPVSHQPLTR